MPISWNEIRQNAIAFSKRWATESRESAERQTFWNELFEVFGQKRRLVASFEEPVKKLSGSWGAIDLFWKGTMLAEHKTRGQDLGKAHAQAIGYIQGLKNTGREDEIPRYVVVSDFALIAIHDLEDGTSAQFPLADFYKHADKFAFIPGYKLHKLAEENPIDIKAVRRLGLLHDALEEGGYTGHHLERFLVRILFCVFAEDTGLFDRNALTDFVESHTREDGSDLGGQLARFFQVLNTPTDRRQANLLEELAALPYVNGDLFAEALDFADFNRAMRDRLLNCCRFDWSRISPAVFGSLFQSVMNSAERRQDGAHYTTERDILKLVRSLFLDDLRAEFDRLAGSKGTQRDARLKEFHAKLGRLKFLDPACGCGNFLVVTYRELRLLEIDVLLALHGTAAQMVLDVSALSVVDVDAMSGIEVNEFPAQIAQVAMWLIDHQMNQRLSEAFGQNVVRLPLKKSATIRHGNALRTDWADVLPPAKCSYVLGNPPFVGGKYQTAAQRADLEHVAGGVKNSGLLDFVALWYLKAADYVRGTSIPVAFVSTNSITQGEQVGVLWGELFRRGVTIHFAHRTFEWQSEAAGKAHVHVVIVGFGMVDKPGKRIFDYDTDPRTPTVSDAKNISPYLVEGSNFAVLNRSKPLCAVPDVDFGSMPNDGGFLLFDDHEKAQFIALEPQSEMFFRRILGSVEFINGLSRWCLWLVDASPSALRSMPEILKRIGAVKNKRLASPRLATRRLAETPSLFGEIRQPQTRYLGIPKTSSDRRRYVPVGFLEPEVIANSELFTCTGASLYHFGILTSSLHNSWLRLVGGRLKSDPRYSVGLVYNNFPWPSEPGEKLRAAVEAKGAAVLAARAKYPAASLADLYDPLTMPPELTKAHAELYRAVERCYRPEPFAADRDRVEFLFAEYERLTNPLTAALDAKPKARRRAAKPSAEADAV